jgi:D-sedoheptulose 7-phosphate isomerase
MTDRITPRAGHKGKGEKAMEGVLRKNAAELGALLPQISELEPQLTAAADFAAAALLRGNKLLACGNGGSASDGSHLTTEFVSRFDRERRPWPAISLCTHGGDLTAIGNDYDFREVFARQVRAFGTPGDVLIAFTTSGQSENVRRALQQAKALTVRTIAFLGRGGGQAAGLADVELLAPGSHTARIQEAHKILLHAFCEMVEDRLQQGAAGDV